MMPNVFMIESPSLFILKAKRKPCSKIGYNVAGWRWLFI